MRSNWSHLQWENYRCVSFSVKGDWSPLSGPLHVKLQPSSSLHPWFPFPIETPGLCDRGESRQFQTRYRVSCALVLTVLHPVGVALEAPLGEGEISMGSNLQADSQLYLACLSPVAFCSPLEGFCLSIHGGEMNSCFFPSNMKISMCATAV